MPIVGHLVRDGKQRLRGRRHAAPHFGETRLQSADENPELREGFRHPDLLVLGSSGTWSAADGGADDPVWFL